jgi:excisionase family DNA binding protein
MEQVIAPDEPEKVAVNLDEIAARYNLSTAYLRRLARKNELPGCRRVGGWRYIVHVAEFDAWLRSGGKDAL